MDLFVMMNMDEVSLNLGMDVARKYGEGTLTITPRNYVQNSGEIRNAGLQLRSHAEI